MILNVRGHWKWTLVPLPGKSHERSAAARFPSCLLSNHRPSVGFLSALRNHLPFDGNIIPYYEKKENKWRHCFFESAKSKAEGTGLSLFPRFVSDKSLGWNIKTKSCVMMEDLEKIHKTFTAHSQLFLHKGYNEIVIRELEPHHSLVHVLPSSIYPSS
jgi:hypothetical protein